MIRKPLDDHPTGRVYSREQLRALADLLDSASNRIGARIWLTEQSAQQTKRNSGEPDLAYSRSRSRPADDSPRYSCRSDMYGPGFHEPRATSGHQPANAIVPNIQINRDEAW